MSILLRILFWGIVWILSLGTMDIDVKYKDGLSIKFDSWLPISPSKIVNKPHQEE